MNLHLTLTTADWLGMFVHFMSLSLLAVGGAITTAPDMHRYLVAQQHWLTDSQFTASIALSQAAPGPNVLFIALLGWNLGLNSAGGLAAGPAGWGWAVLGAFVHSSNWNAEALRHVFIAAAETGLDVDLHVDEELNPEARGLAATAQILRETGFAGRVVCGHTCALAAQRDAAAQGDDLDVFFRPRQPADLGRDLVGQLARRTQHQRLDGEPARVEPGQQRQGKGCRLAAAGLGLGDQVLPGQGNWQAGGLDRGHAVVAQLLQIGQRGGREGQGGERSGHARLSARGPVF